MVVARRTGGRRWYPVLLARSSRSVPVVPRPSSRACRIVLAAPVSRAGACCQNPLRLGNTFDATRPRASKVLPNRSENLARRARMRHGGPPGTGFASKMLPNRRGFSHGRPPRERGWDRLPNRRVFRRGRRLRARSRSGRGLERGLRRAAGEKDGPPDERGRRPGARQGAVSEAASARPRRWRQWAGGRPGARRWREGPRPREARRARPRSWSRS